LKLTALCGLGLFISPPLRGLLGAETLSPQRSLSLYHVRTQESLSVIYRTATGYVEKALEDISFLMRDRRTGEVKKIDPRLLDYLHEIKTILTPGTPFYIISGYRTRETNRYLRHAGKGAVPNSYHMKGKAVDFCMPGIRTATLRQAALEVEAGGVGHYPDRHFVHLDIGPIRCWSA
jgi:uncharacterized protein YcbK (DUF882 family)